jgi:hypothetical protein
MPGEPALDPRARALYGDILRPPVGHVFDVAVATTYSLDFETALVVPATLAFHAAETRTESLDTPLALLEGLERLSGRIAVFCEAGRIHGAPRGANRLTALLEEAITEVAAPGGGAFHPKLWLLRFTPLEPGPARLRLAILSRNLTRDISWDLGLCLDGTIGETVSSVNDPLCALLQALPGLAQGRATPDRARALIETLLPDLARAVWDSPPGVDSVSFAVNGLGGAPWRPRVGRVLGIVSPFVTGSALAALVGRLAPSATRLLGRAEELARIDPATLGRFGRIQVLDDLVETESDVPDAVARGLHAKAFITQRYSTTEITVGSGNATTAALDGSNVEVFATLAGHSRDLGTIDAIFAAERLGRFTRDFQVGEGPDTAADPSGEVRLDAARRALAGAQLTLRCDATGTGTYRLLLGSEPGAGLRPGIDAQVWPLVLGDKQAVPLALGPGTTVSLGTLALRDVTRWIGVRLTDRESGLEQVFSLGTVLTGLPDDRNAEILRAFVENRDAFLRYLRLLLADAGDPSVLLEAGRSGDRGAGWRSEDELCVLEDMVRALADGGRQLHDVERLVVRLGDGTGPDGTPVIPPDFRALWQSFRDVLEEPAGG